MNRLLTSATLSWHLELLICSGGVDFDIDFNDQIPRSGERAEGDDFLEDDDELDERGFCSCASCCTTCTSTPQCTSSQICSGWGCSGGVCWPGAGNSCGSGACVSSLYPNHCVAVSLLRRTLLVRCVVSPSKQGSLSLFCCSFRSTRAYALLICGLALVLSGRSQSPNLIFVGLFCPV